MNYLVYDTVGLCQRFFDTWEEAHGFYLMAVEAYRDPSVLKFCSIVESQLTRSN